MNHSPTPILFRPVAPWVVSLSLSFVSLFVAMANEINTSTLNPQVREHFQAWLKYHQSRVFLFFFFSFFFLPHTTGREKEVTYGRSCLIRAKESGCGPEHWDMTHVPPCPEENFLGTTYDRSRTTGRRDSPRIRQQAKQLLAWLAIEGEPNKKKVTPKKERNREGQDWTKDPRVHLFSACQIGQLHGKARKKKQMKIKDHGIFTISEDDRVITTV